MTDLDLFGNPLPPPPPPARDKAQAARRRAAIPRGFAAPPGTGPEGETCGSCTHIRRTESASGKVFPKCALRQSDWSCTARTDIRVRAAACRHHVKKLPA